MIQIQMPGDDDGSARLQPLAHGDHLVIFDAGAFEVGEAPFQGEWLIQ